MKRVRDTSALPLAIDLFTGLHGWAEGLVAEGWRVVGFDLEDMCAQFGAVRPRDVRLVIQDVLTLHGSQFKDAALIVASPPCQAYSYRAMPWKRAKALPPPDNSLFEACFRIQQEACEAAGRHIPLVVENVCGAQKWVGRARWHFGSFYLWGDVPALMPITMKAQKFNPDGTQHGVGSWFAIADSKNRGASVDGQKNPGFCFDGSGRSFQSESVDRHAGIKQGGDWFNAASLDGEGMQSISRRSGSKSPARKAASAMIAKIPLVLSRHIAAAWRPSHAA